MNLFIGDDITLSRSAWKEHERPRLLSARCDGKTEEYLLA